MCALRRSCQNTLLVDVDTVLGSSRCAGDKKLPISRVISARTENKTGLFGTGFTGTPVQPAVGFR